MFYVCRRRKTVHVSPSYLSIPRWVREVRRQIEADHFVGGCEVVVAALRVLDVKCCAMRFGSDQSYEVEYSCIVQRFSTGDVMDGTVEGFSDCSVTISVGQARVEVSRFELPEDVSYDRRQRKYVRDDRCEAFPVNSSVRFKVKNVYPSRDGGFVAIGTMKDDYLGPFKE